MLDSWKEEKQSAWLYEIVAAHEEQADISSMFRALGTTAEKQADIWAKKITAQDPSAVLEFTPSWRVRIVAVLVRLLGTRATKPILAAMKIRGLSTYDRTTLPGTHAMPTAVDEIGSRHRHALSGGNLRAAVFGANDGLVSNTSLVMGIAGAGAGNNTILMTGVAGLLAGALSMAAGEYVSMRSQREFYESQIALEKAELEAYPEEEVEELALIYHTRGLPLEQAREFARSLMADPQHALDTLAREELGLDPNDLGSPWAAGLFSFGAFAAGAAVPILPFLLGSSATPIVLAAALAGLALFLIGCSLSLFTGRGALTSGVRMVCIGTTAGLATYFIGHWLGVSLA